MKPTAATAREQSSMPVEPVVHPIVFFDGDCAFCSHTVNSLIRLDSRRVLRFAPLQGETAAKLVPQEDRTRLDTLVLLDESGLHRRSTAVVRICRHVGGLPRLGGAVLWLVPRLIRDAGYRLVAKHRLRLVRSQACRLPTADEQRLVLP